MMNTVQKLFARCIGLLIRVGRGFSLRDGLDPVCCFLRTRR